MFSLKNYNTFGIDAACSRFVEYDSVEALQSLLPEVVAGGKWMHIGGGSNLLFTRNFEGTILHSRICGIEEVRRDAETVWVRVGAGEVWDDWVSEAVCRGYYGLENLSLIPGEVGASAVQNIGAYGAEAGQFIETVETVEVATGQRRSFAGEDCGYGYRSSIFKKALRGLHVVTHVVFRLSLRFVPQLSYRALAAEVERRGICPASLTAEGLRGLIIEVRRSKLPDPSDLGSAGSFFMNPVVSAEKCASLLEQFPTMPHFPVEGGVKVPAGWLIEQCGWKGRRVGHAGVYEKQALVLVNHGGATGAEIWSLAQQIQADVQEKFGIAIHPEANIIQ